jgi:hypothetical protein
MKASKSDFEISLLVQWCIQISLQLEIKILWVGALCLILFSFAGTGGDRVVFYSSSCGILQPGDFFQQRILRFTVVTVWNLRIFSKIFSGRHGLKRSRCCLWHPRSFYYPTFSYTFSVIFFREPCPGETRSRSIQSNLIPRKPRLLQQELRNDFGSALPCFFHH